MKPCSAVWGDCYHPGRYNAVYRRFDRGLTHTGARIFREQILHQLRTVLGFRILGNGRYGWDFGCFHLHLYLTFDNLFARLHRSNQSIFQNVLCLQIDVAIGLEMLVTTHANCQFMSVQVNIAVFVEFERRFAANQFDAVACGDGDRLANG